MEVEKDPEGKSKKPSFNQENYVACLTVSKHQFQCGSSAEHKLKYVVWAHPLYQKLECLFSEKMSCHNDS